MLVTRRRPRGLGDADSAGWDLAYNTPAPASDYVPTPYTPSTAAPASSTDFNWNSLWATLIPNAAKVANTAVTSQPRPGTYMSTGPNGQSVYYSMPTGTAAASGLSIPGLTSGTLSSTSMLLIAAVVIGGLFLMEKKD